MEDMDCNVEASVPSISILWFRHGLRIHDNPSLLAAIADKTQLFLPLFIFDGESAGTKIVGYNRMRYLIESLEDLDKSFRSFGGSGLKLFQGNPVDVFSSLMLTHKISKVCFEQDCEPIWRPRDDKVKEFCKENGIEVVECVSHTLYNPAEILEANGGEPPLTFASLMFVVSCLGKPPRPLPSPGMTKDTINFFGESTLPFEIKFPVTPEQFGVELGKAVAKNPRKGGETEALALFQRRLDIEKSAFEKGLMQPNHSSPDLMMGASLSPCLRFGAISVRYFYWGVQDLFDSIVGGKLSCETITAQLFWREFFYVMSVPNGNFDKMLANSICLNIPWATGTTAKENLKKWKEGKTGYPFIDAGMRQLEEDGWMHHVTRNAVACFLTRSDLWISWEKGLKHFLKYLLDADWSVCSGNWMWVSSSAFETVLDCSYCICPTNYAQRLDPDATFIKRFVPELRNFPVPYIFEPWKSSLEQQKAWGCVIGEGYPAPIVDHSVASKINSEEMVNLRNRLTGGIPTHLCPSNTMEARQFMCIPDNCFH